MKSHPKVYDVLILGAGPAGIAAARHLRKEHPALSVRVLEARSRVGGRAHSSDALNAAGTKLDHGAKWIHGTCSDNRIVKLLSEDLSLFSRLPEDRGIQYQVCLPWDAKSTNTTSHDDFSTPPPFEVSETKANVEHMIVQKIPDQRKQIPIQTLTKILTRVAEPTRGESNTITAKEVSKDTRKIAKLIFRDMIQSCMEHPRQRIETQSKITILQEAPLLEGASLMDVLLWLHQDQEEIRESESINNENDVERRRHAQFASLCRNKFVAKNLHVQQAIEAMEEQAKEDFQAEVLAMLNLEIYTFLESWEGAPIHSISALYGMEGTCLSGGNTVLACGYGGLIERLAYPLLQDNVILLEHEVVSIETTKTSSQQGHDGSLPNTVVKYRTRTDANNDTVRELHGSICICALPLGVLRAAINSESKNDISFFQPELPLSLQNSIRSLGIAVRNKIELLFPTRWWPEHIGRITLACTHLQQRPTYHPYTTFIVESASSHSSSDSSSSDNSKNNCNPNILVCYVAGLFAEETEQKSN